MEGKHRMLMASKVSAVIENDQPTPPRARDIDMAPDGAGDNDFCCGECGAWGETVKGMLRYCGFKRKACPWWHLVKNVERWGDLTHTAGDY